MREAVFFAMQTMAPFFRDMSVREGNVLGPREPTLYYPRMRARYRFAPWISSFVCSLVALLGCDDGSPPAELYFVHVPAASCAGEDLNMDGTPDVTRENVIAGVQAIVDELVADWRARHPDGGEPKVALVGFAGRWCPGGEDQVNWSGEAAMAVRSSTGARVLGSTVAIDFVAAPRRIGELLKECNIVIA